MTTVINFRCFLLVVILFLITSCKKDKKLTLGADQGNLNITNSISTATFGDTGVQQIYDKYLAIKAGLVNADHEVVQMEAKKLESLLTDNENKQLKATLKLVSLTKDLAKQRDFFVTITDQVYKLVSSSEIVSGEIYKQYCPMAFDGEGGYWLSNSEEIRNPYFGSTMLKCGSVKETITKN